MTPYAQVLGERLAALPEASRALHGAFGRWQGRITVVPARWAPLRLAARLAGLPPAVTDQPFELVCEQDGKRALWTREIGAARMVSVQWAEGDVLMERLGAMTVGARLVPFAAGGATGDGGLRLEVVRLRVLGLPLPRLLWPDIAAREYQAAGRYHFEISVALPFGGPRLIAYHGWLDTCPDA